MSIFYAKNQNPIFSVMSPDESTNKSTGTNFGKVADWADRARMPAFATTWRGWQRTGMAPDQHGDDAVETMTIAAYRGQRHENQIGRIDSPCVIGSVTKWECFVLLISHGEGDVLCC
jgi:hypothetical protein